MLDHIPTPTTTHTVPPNQGPRLATFESGTGRPVVFVHGTPSSSFEFRHVARALSKDHRCIRIDHLGFGASDKSPDHDYSIKAHQRRFAATLGELNLQDAIFVLHDVGTAIALPWMLAHSDRVRAVVLANTFLWPAEGPIRALLWFYATALGRWIYRATNLSAKYLLPWVWGKRRKLTPELHAQYLRPFADKRSRSATAALPGELIGPTMRELADSAGQLARWPTAAVWGMADPMVGAKELDRWRRLLPGMRVEEVAEAGHFVADEAPEAIVRAVHELAELP